MARRESIARKHPRVFSARVKQIELRTRGLVESLFSGEYRSVFKGRGLEFAEVREYQPGDDIRAIDWNVTARRGRLFIKQHVEERELTALLMVDLSGSQDFGTGFATNARIASEIACILALTAARNNDHVGLLVVTDHTELFIPPDTGRRHALRLVFGLLSLEPAGRRTRLSPGLEFLAKVLRRRATVFLISDFLVDFEADPRLRPIASRFSFQHDLVPIRLNDPRQEGLPDVGLLRVVDPESGERRIVDTREVAVRGAYSQHAGEARDRLTGLFRELGLEVVEVGSEEDYVPVLAEFFRARQRRPVRRRRRVRGKARAPAGHGAHANADPR